MATDISISRALQAQATLEGLFNRRDPRTIERDFATPFYQHNPLFPDGAEAIVGLVGSLTAATGPIVKVARVVGEGDFAAIHSHYAWSPSLEFDGGRGTAVVDIFRYGPEGRIVEHWDAVQAIPETTASGHTMLDGAGDPNAPADAAANKVVVRRLFEAFNSGETSQLDGLIVPGYIQHNPQIPDGLEAVKGFFGSVGPIDVDLIRLVAAGDLVVTHSNYRTFNLAIIDIFRVEDGMIVEHWDVTQSIPGTTVSGNDMFGQLS